MGQIVLSMVGLTCIPAIAFPSLPVAFLIAPVAADFQSLLCWWAGRARL